MSNKLKSNILLGAKNRRNGRTFSSLPHHVQDSEMFVSLSSMATKLLINMFRDYKGNNNGDLSCALGILKKRGWKSDSHIRKARDELIEKGFIVRTRFGNNRRPHLYAVTWLGIDECDGKLEVKPQSTSLGFWKDGVNHWHKK